MWCDCFLSLVSLFTINSNVFASFFQDDSTFRYSMFNELVFRRGEGIVVGCLNLLNKIVKPFTQKKSFHGS